MIGDKFYVCEYCFTRDVDLGIDVNCPRISETPFTCLYCKDEVYKLKEIKVIKEDLTVLEILDNKLRKE